VNGAKNAALLAVSILSLSNPGLAAALENFRKQQADAIMRTVI